MNKERYKQIIDEVYGKFITEADSIKEGYENGEILGSQPHIDVMFSNPDELIILTKEEFIKQSKADKEFSERWGLKIEERELSLDERNELLNKVLNRNHKRKDCFSDEEFETETLKDANAFNIPTKLITVTYNNETIEVYE
jgi:hypothetical protein